MLKVFDKSAVWNNIRMRFFLISHACCGAVSTFETYISRCIMPFRCCRSSEDCHLYSFFVAEDDDGHRVGRDGIFIYFV